MKHDQGKNAKYWRRGGQQQLLMETTKRQAQTIDQSYIMSQEPFLFLNTARYNHDSENSCSHKVHITDQ